MSTVTTLTGLETPSMEEPAPSNSSDRSKIPFISYAQAQGVSSEAKSQALEFDAEKSVTPPHHNKTQQPSAIRIREHHGLDGIELEDMRARPTSEPSPTTVPGNIYPNFLPELTMSNRDEKIYLATLSYNLATAGWNDGSLGPLLPRIQEHYHIGYTVVSILWVGFIAGALSNVYMSEKFGFGKTITLGMVNFLRLLNCTDEELLNRFIAAAAQILAYTTIAVAPPYPIFCLALFFNGWALSLQDAGSNSFIASIPRNEKVNMGILHATY
ncbi:hypothetical protein FRC00_000333, partial [Tulasnella sp. 408]